MNGIAGQQGSTAEEERITRGTSHGMAQVLPDIDRKVFVPGDLVVLLGCRQNIRVPITIQVRCIDALGFIDGV